MFCLMKSILGLFNGFLIWRLLWLVSFSFLKFSFLDWVGTFGLRLLDTLILIETYELVMDLSLGYGGLEGTTFLEGFVYIFGGLEGIFLGITV